MLIAFVGRFTSDKKEYFPFFRWSLYSKTPNTLKHAYVMVEKLEDSTFQKPIDIRELYNFHHINSADVNLIVQNFYSDVNNQNKFSESEIFSIIPKETIFNLYITSADLSLEDYNNSMTKKKILTFKNNQFYFE